MHRRHTHRGLALACVAWALLAAPAAFAQTFYVDNQSGTCAPNGPGTSAKPYCTISAAISAHKGAGVTILVRPGLYRETVTLNASGAAGNPFVIQGLPTPGNPVIIDGADDLSAASNWMLSSGTVYVTSSVTWGTPSQVFSDGARLTPSTASPNALPVGTWRFVSGAGLYVNVGGNPSTHVIRVGRRQYGFRLSTKNYVTIDGFTVMGTEDRSIYLSNNADNCVISNNTVSFANRYGIQVNSCSGVLVSSNTVSDSNDHGIAITASSTGCTIQNNDSFRNADPSQRRANGIYLNRSTNNLLQGNRVHDNQDTGMDFETGANYNISLQNFSYNNGDHGYDHVEGTNNTHIGDVASGNYMDGFSIEGATPGTHLTNCIAINNGLTTNEFDLWVDAQSSVGFVSDYNIFWNSTSQQPVKYIATLYSSVATYSANSGQDAHSIQANPLFVNPAAGDFRLQTGSPAIDNANSGVPNWPTLDASGHARVDDPTRANAGVGPVTFADRGALEYLANQAPTVGAPLTISTAEAAPLSFSVSATDPDGDAITSLTANTSALPAGHNAAFAAGAGNTSGTFTWTPTYVDSRPAPYNVTFTASNAASGSATTAITVTNTDRAPVVTAPATATISEASTVSLTIGASDPDGTSITSLTANTSALPAGNNAAFTAAAGNTSGTFTWTPTYSDGRPAPYNVTFTASNALSGSAATAITVTNVDRAPSVSAPATVTTPEASVLSLPVTASDPDGDAITSLTANTSALPAGNNAAFTAGAGNTSGTLTWTPTFSDGQPSPYNVTFTASNGLSGSATTAITVTNVDRAPSVNAPATATAAEATALSIPVTASDPDGDAISSLTANTSALPAGNNAAFTAGAGNTSGTFTWTPTFSDGRPTAYNVTFTASNALSGSATTAITVTNVDRAPVVVAPISDSVREGGTVTVHVTASDPDGDAISSLTANTSALPAGNNAAFTVGAGNTSGTLTWMPTYNDTRPQPYDVTFTASNALSGSAMTAISVVNEDQAPIVDAPATATGFEASAISIVVSAHDPDSDPISSLTANTTGLPAGNNAAFTTGAENTSGTLTWTPTYSDGGGAPYSVTFTATSNAISGSSGTAITVNNTDRAPTVSAPATAGTPEGSAVSVTVTASDPDGDAITSLAANTSGLPAGNNAAFAAGAGNTSGTFTWTPTHSDGRPAPYNVTFTASNALSGSAATAITVTDVDGPVVTAPSSDSVREGGTTILHVTASDPDGDAITSLTADFTGLPAGNNAAFTVGGGNTSGTMTWTPTDADARPTPYNVTFNASNALSGSAATAITVTENDQAPVVSAPATVTTPEASALSVPVTASDPDADAITSLTADLSGLPAGNNAQFTAGAGNHSGTLTWTPTHDDGRPAPYNVTFTASNALSGSAVTAITVTENDQAPVVSAPATASTPEASALSLPVTASDPDGNAISSLTANLSALPAGNNAAFTAGAGNTLGTLTWTPTYSDGRPAPYSVTFTASNALSGSATTAITVTNVDRVPSVSAPATATTAEATALSIPVTASDPDGDAIGSLTADVSALPAGNNAAFTAGAGDTSGTFTWTPTFSDGRPTAYNVTFTASNALSGSATTAITVTNVDRAPIVNAPATASASVGTQVSVSVTASDPDGDAISSLTANLTGLPAGNNAAFTAGAGNTSGTLTWTPASGTSRPDPYNVSFAASNALSGSATTAITVNPANQPPTATLVMSPLTGNAPLSTTADASASSDPDGTILSYRFDFGDGTIVGFQSSATASHSYNAGNWTATVTVTDNSGAVGTASASLIVAAVPSEPNLITNPSFEPNTSGWGSYNSAAFLRVAGGFDGNFSIQLTRAAGTSGGFGLNDTPNWILSVPAVGTKYRFTAWVRSASATGTAKLQVREYLGSTLMGSLYSNGVVLSPTWQLLTVDYVCTRATSTIDFQVVDFPLATGEVFLTDNIAIRNVTGGSAVAALPDGVAGATAELPLRAAIYPNMSRSEAMLEFTTPRPGRTRIDLFDVQGRRVRQLMNEVVAAGSHRMTIELRGQDGARLSSGVYFYRIQTEREALNGRLVVVR